MNTLNSQKTLERHSGGVDPRASEFGNPLPKTIAAYVVAFLVPLMAISLFLYEGKRHVGASLNQDMREKAKYYSIHKKEFDLILLGDSRTYCGIHSDLMDKHLGTHSVNLAHFAHWFPTQYPFFQAIVKDIPKDTLVVWSVGNINFLPGTSIQNRYPIGFKNVPSYLFWGYSWKDIADNVCYFNPLLQIFVESKNLHTALFDQLNKIIWQTTGKALPVSAANASITDTNKTESVGNAVALTDEQFAVEKKRLEDKYIKYPDVVGVWVVAEKNKINSVVLYKARGSYYRIELDPAFFRAKQKEIVKDVKTPAGGESKEEIKAAAEYWQTFVAMIDLFKKNKVNLVVNQIEDAPFIYRTYGTLKPVRNFMHDKVKAYVEAQGFKYITTDLDSLSDSDYFDYNHLNSQGCEKYDAMLAEKLKPFLNTSSNGGDK